MKTMNTVLLDENVQLNDIYIDPRKWSSFKCASTTSVDVEQSLIDFKNIMLKIDVTASRKKTGNNIIWF